ncbi:MAG: DNA repair protein RecN [Bdellovibrionaceae bacterium]|nr:DNA repair protein RecN [Pseudobdellovibrionaceae bacterium]
MLLELKVSNFAIIDNVHIAFRPGLNILSGETGAGKSILLKSLGLLMGEKAASESVRTGAEQAVIEGSFDLSHRSDIRQRLQDMGIDAIDDQLVVRRIVSLQTTKSRVYLNGSLSTLASLRDVVAPLVEVTGQAVPLIEMTGQHENRNLMSRAYHLDLLDQYTGVWKLRAAFEEKFARLQNLREEVEQIRSDARNRAQRLDFLVYQRDEIKALGLKQGEDEEIENETKRLKHSARLEEFASQAEDMLYAGDDSVTSRLHYVIQRANDLRTIDPKLAQLMEPLNQARTLISEVSYEVRDYTKNLEADPGRLDELEERLSRLRLLQKKYGSTANEILSALEEIEREIHQLENADEILDEKVAEVARLEAELHESAVDMHNRRTSGAKLLEKGVAEELKDLNMKGVDFLVQVDWSDSISSTGQSHAEFMTRSSKADVPRPLAKFASGGELSRILLSMKQVVGASQHPRTYLFDEVDAGVSGPTAEKVGRKLKRIAKGQQVICITHLPQVASFGDVHFCIQKNQSKKSVQTEVAELRKEDRVKEIARLISGEKITQTSLAHAEQLLADSHL